MFEQHATSMGYGYPAGQNNMRDAGPLQQGRLLPSLVRRYGREGGRRTSAGGRCGLMARTERIVSVEGQRLKGKHRGRLCAHNKRRRGRLTQLMSANPDNKSRLRCHQKATAPE